MWELDHKESWTPKNWWFWTVVLKTLESALDNKEIKPVNPKGNQPWIFIGRTDVEAETPILWPPDVKNWCFQIVVLEKTLESPLDWKMEPVNPEGNQPWIFIGKTGTEAKAPTLWPPDAKSWLIGKTLMLGKIEGNRGWQRMRWLDGRMDSTDVSSSKLREIVKDREA